MRPHIAIGAVELLLEKLAPNLVKDNWKVEINTRATTRLGLCSFRRKTIYLTESFVLLNDCTRIELTGKHEIAHALVGPGHGHGIVWKRKAIELGIPPTTCSSDANMPKGKFVAVCPGCQKIFWFYRKPKPGINRNCIKCGRHDGRLTFIPYTGDMVLPGSQIDDYADDI